MKQLNEGIISREEIADIMNIETSDKHFARKVKTNLDNWGYSYEYSRKGVTITRKPQTAIERLSEIMIRNYNLDVRIDVYAFSVFFYCLIQELDDFIYMPWAERELYMDEVFGVKVSEKTLRNWANRLFKTNTITKDSDRKSYWYSFRVDGDIYREMIDYDNEDRKKFWKRFFELKKEEVEDFGKQLIAEFGGWYYSCSGIVVSAFDTTNTESINEICELVEEVVNNGYVETKEVVTREIVEIPKEVIPKKREFVF